MVFAQEELSKEIAECFTLLLRDIGDGEEEQEAFSRLLRLRETVTPETVINEVVRQALDPAFELGYLARAGYPEVASLLFDYANGSSEDDCFFACLGLAALGYEEAFSHLEDFARKRHPLSKEIQPWADVYPELCCLSHPLAEKLRRRMLNGEFGIVPREYAKPRHSQSSTNSYC